MIIKTTKDSIVYVICPANIKTGGTELAHQLVYQLNACGINSSICYICGKSRPVVCTGFEQYVQVFVTLDDVDDNEKNVVVIPESWTFLIHKFKHIRIAVWWMSVDNYLKNYSILFAIKRYGLRQGLKTLAKKFVNEYSQLSIQSLKEIKIHFVQSEYARIFLKSMGIDAVGLSDYINDLYCNNIVNRSKKEDIIVYNPSKGGKVTSEIKKQYKGKGEWIPLINMTNEEMRNTLSRAKVYIDFGPFPGKDRIPREAAMSFCCLITGTLGASGNKLDLPIDDNYRFSSPLKNILLITEKINDCIENYDLRINDFEEMRHITKNEKALFERQVRNIFCED